jgi:hypothetical protein
LARLHRNKPSKWAAAGLAGLAGLAGALAAAFIVAVPAPAHAGFLDFLFGGAQERPTPPPDVSSYAEPSPPAAPLAPMRSGSESVRSSGGTGRSVAFCVRLCDGQHFPLERMANATPVETCRAMCPASKTKIFFGNEIDHAVAADGTHYASLDSAFVYRQRLVPDCTCNGKDAFGLAPFDASSDPTLRPGDIVATKSGFETYAGKHGQADTFTPVDRSTIAAELNAGSTRTRLTSRSKGPAIADEEPGIIVPRPGDAQAAR